MRTLFCLSFITIALSTGAFAQNQSEEAGDAINTERQEFCDNSLIKIQEEHAVAKASAEPNKEYINDLAKIYELFLPLCLRKGITLPKRKAFCEVVPDVVSKEVNRLMFNIDDPQARADSFTLMDSFEIYNKYCN